MDGPAITLVAPEVTSECRKPVYHLLEADRFTCWLLNAEHVKNIPSRLRAGRLDAVWPAKVVERPRHRPRRQ
ncbi:hypothetical protein [Streptosporangium sp. NPDC049644]|uniref:hypothetical protein n=1 Tax=Streptosporangium sp. NPDC049644 TaxID=3155507 RepID=UPI00343ADC69